MRRQQRSVAFGVAFALLTLLRSSSDARGSSQGQSLVSVPLEVVALEPTGAPVDSLTPESLAVTVDGKPRRVLWIRRVSRGPGAVAEANVKLRVAPVVERIRRVFSRPMTRLR